MGDQGEEREWGSGPPDYDFVQAIELFVCIFFR